MQEAIHDYDMVALLEDVPEEQLTAGDVGAVVYTHQGGIAFEVEFPPTAARKSVVATVPREQLLKLKNLPIRMGA